MLNQSPLVIQIHRFGGLWGYEVGQLNALGSFKPLLVHACDWQTENAAYIEGLKALNRYRSAWNRWIVRHIDKQMSLGRRG